jgi:hypothetical protein
MFRRFFVAVLLLAALSTPAFAVPSRDDGDRRGSSIIRRVITRIVHALEDYNLGFPKP